MPDNRFHIVDVFAESRYTGNQLAVVEDGASLTDEEMQAIAAEFDFSETTFVARETPRDGGYDARIFTPREEIPFAGHPTLGTAAVVRERFADGGDVTLNLPVGRIPVAVQGSGDSDVLWMTQRPPEFGERLEHATLAEVLSLDVADLETAYPVQVVSTGLPTVVVPLADRDALERVEIDRPAYDALVSGREAKNVLAFCADPREDENDLADRVFAPYYGVPEDPATGSSNGCLAGYLVRHEYFGGDELAVSVEQGYEMGRPSRLHMEAEAGESDVQVRVGGRVVHVAEGSLT